MIDYVRTADGSLRKVHVERVFEPRSERSDSAIPSAGPRGPIFRRRPVGTYVVHLPLSVRAAGERIAAEHGLTFARMASRSRLATTVRARHRWWAATKWSLGLSYPETGALFGVDHTTVMAAVRKVETQLEQEHTP